MVIFVFILIAMAIIGVSLFVSYQVAQNNRLTWQQAAGRLKLHFGVAMGPFGIGHIYGTLDGVRINVDTHTVGSGKNRKVYTRYRANFPKSLQLGLRLSEQGFLNDLGRLFGSQDIIVGDDSFDRSIVVKGRDEDRVRSFLNEERRRAVLRMMRICSHTVVDDVKVVCMYRGTDSSCDTIVNRVKILMTFVKEFRELEAPEEQKASREHHQERHEEPKSTPQIRVVPKEEAERLVELVAPETVETEPEPKSPPDEIEEPEGESHAEESPSEEATPEPEVDVVEAVEPEIEETLPEAEEIEVTEIAPEEPEETATAEVPQPPVELEPQPEPLPDELSVHEVCQHLFGEGTTSIEVEERFKEYQDQAVCWTGKLRYVQRYYSDMVFGDGPGGKLTIEVGEVESGYGLKSQVKAIVQIPEARYNELKNKTGEQVTFIGKLSKAEGFSKEVYVTDGQVETEG